MGIRYINGTLILENSVGKMFFNCDDEFAGKIMNALREAKKHPLQLLYDKNIETQKLIDSLSNKNDRESAKKCMELEGYTFVGVTENIELYVGVWEETFTDMGKSLCTFKYLQDKLPNKHGSTHVNIYIRLD